MRCSAAGVPPEGTAENLSAAWHVHGSRFPRPPSLRVPGEAPQLQGRGSHVGLPTDQRSNCRRQMPPSEIQWYAQGGPARSEPFCDTGQGAAADRAECPGQRGGARVNPEKGKRLEPRELRLRAHNSCRGRRHPPTTPQRECGGCTVVAPPRQTKNLHRIPPVLRHATPLYPIRRRRRP